MQYLQQKSGAQTQQEFEAYIQQLGEEGLQREYAQFMQMIQQQQVSAKRFGGMLNYIGKLRGACPEGYEMQFFKQGGQICKKCVQKAKMEDGGKTPQNPVDAFKCGRKMKKARKAQDGLATKKIAPRSIGNPKMVPLEEEVMEYYDPYEGTVIRRWADGTTSQMQTSEGGNVFIGRQGEVGITNVPDPRYNAIADSLTKADWSQKVVRPLPNKVKKKSK